MSWFVKKEPIELTDKQKESYIRKIEKLEKQAMDAAMKGNKRGVLRATKKAEKLIREMNGLPGLEGVAEAKKEIYKEFNKDE
jgi:hypothetical protein